MTDADRKFFFQLVDDFVTDKDDEDVALLMVETYNTGNLTKIIRDIEPGKITINDIAIDLVAGKCGFKWIEIPADASLEVDCTEVPF